MLGYQVVPWDLHSRLSLRAGGWRFPPSTMSIVSLAAVFGCHGGAVHDIQKTAARETTMSIACATDGTKLLVKSICET